MSAGAGASAWASGPYLWSSTNGFIAGPVLKNRTNRQQKIKQVHQEKNKQKKVERQTGTQSVDERAWPHSKRNATMPFGFANLMPSALQQVLCRCSTRRLLPFRQPLARRGKRLPITATFSA